MHRKWYTPLASRLNDFGSTPAWRFLMRRSTRAVLAWTVALVAVAVAACLMWSCYDQEGRPERTTGYVYIDFSGQWIMGRMLARGEGPFLYDGDHLRRAIREAYGTPDAEHVYGWLEQSQTHPEVRGPLYPPIHALYFYPLGLLPPLPAYRIAQATNVLLTFAIGFIAWMLTRGRIWAAVAVAAVVAWPGYNGALGLAQNALLTLALLLLGWLLASRGRPWLGGVAWGFLAFKPVWAAAFFLAPLLSGRWRMCAAMLLTAAGLALATLPFVGWRPWLDWLELGRAASLDYRTAENWIFLSRDLQGLPRRWLHFVNGVPINADDPVVNLIALGLWLIVPVGTVGIALWRWRRPAGTDGLAAAFLLLGAFLSCYHFMYYDILAAVLPLCLLCAEPARFFDRRPRGPPGHGGWPWNIAVIALIALFFILPHVTDAIDYMTNKGRTNTHSPPFDTYCLLGLWVLCGWRWLRQDGSATSADATLMTTRVVARQG